MKDNIKTIKYSICNEKFKYNLVKSELKKGSLISKKEHPIKEVEDYKKRLLNRRYIKEYNSNNYVLKKTINTGGLMAYNLHSDELKKGFEIDYSIVINNNDNKLNDEFRYKNIYTTDSIIHINVDMCAYKLKKISKLELNFSFISGHNADHFTPIEKTVKELLIKHSYISEQARHGIANMKECDIVDDLNNKQIEVVTEFKNRLKKHKTPHKNIDLFILEFVDSNLIDTSKALIEKFLKKSYTDKYEKQIAIFCLGNTQAVKTMLEQLISNLKKKPIKNHFKKLYILFYDVITEEYYWYPTPENRIEKIDNLQDKIIYKTNVNYNDMHIGEKYLIECENIFTSETMVAYLSKEEIMDFASKIKLIIYN